MQKLVAYTQMKSVAKQTLEFLALLNDTPKTDNDLIDNQFLYELYCDRVDILIIVDRKMRIKARKLGIEDKLFTINAFITKAVLENPNLIEYKYLSVFGKIDVKNTFFDTFSEAYPGFERWLSKNVMKEAYICYNDRKQILRFLYLKTEDENENYNGIRPKFSPMKRLKVGTFKVEASGFRLGERFIKIIFDNAIERCLNEIYVTLFMDRPELKALYAFFPRWRFSAHGLPSPPFHHSLFLVPPLFF